MGFLTMEDLQPRATRRPYGWVGRQRLAGLAGLGHGRTDMGDVGNLFLPRRPEPSVQPDPSMHAAALQTQVAWQPLVARQAQQASQAQQARQAWSGYGPPAAPPFLLPAVSQSPISFDPQASDGALPPFFLPLPVGQEQIFQAFDEGEPLPMRGLGCDPCSPGDLQGLGGLKREAADAEKERLSRTARVLVETSKSPGAGLAVIADVQRALAELDTLLPWGAPWWGSAYDSSTVVHSNLYQAQTNARISQASRGEATGAPPPLPGEGTAYGGWKKGDVNRDVSVWQETAKNVPGAVKDEFFDPSSLFNRLLGSLKKIAIGAAVIGGAIYVGPHVVRAVRKARRSNPRRRARR